jgi:hypothetical protein
MELKEPKLRLDLIQIVNSAITQDMPYGEFSELRGLIEALCRHKELPIQTCLSSPRVRILGARCGDAFTDWAAR